MISEGSCATEDWSNGCLPLPSQEYILFKNLFKYKTFSCNNILQYYCLYCFINQINVAFLSMRDFQSMKKS